jgi:hypothetical protein
MSSPAAKSPYTGYRFPTEIISHAVWLYFHFPLALRMVEELLAARGIIVSHETITEPEGLSGAPVLQNRGKQGRPGALPRLPQGHRHRDFKIAHEPQNRLGRAEPESGRAGGDPLRFGDRFQYGLIASRDRAECRTPGHLDHRQGLGLPSDDL